MTLSDKPGPSLIKITRLECTPGRGEGENGKSGQSIPILFLKARQATSNFFWCTCTNLSLLLPVITLIAPLNSSVTLSLTSKMTDKISYCGITGHRIPVSSPLSESPHLISNSGIKASTNAGKVRRTTYDSFRTVLFLCKHNQDLCFSKLPGLNKDQ